jgi:transposase-like protein
MGSSTNGRVQRSASEWASLVSRYEESGRSGAAFCRAEGISRSTFDLWRRKLRSSTPSPAKPVKSFVELTPSEDRIGGWSVEIELPDGTLARLRG